MEMEPWERAIWPCARNPSLLDEPRKVAKEEGVEKIRLINIAVAEKLSVIELNAIFASVGRAQMLGGRWKFSIEQAPAIRNAGVMKCRACR